MKDSFSVTRHQVLLWNQTRNCSLIIMKNLHEIEELINYQL